MLSRPRHVLEVSDLTKADIENILTLASLENPQRVLDGKGVALIFEHPSARTRNAAEMAVFQLGGHPITISGNEIGIDKRETAEDIARVLARFHSLVAARVADHNSLVRMADAIDHSTKHVPVVNLLSNRDHVTQILADMLTIKQRFATIEKVKVAYIGDPNNVCYSLFHAAKILGFELSISSPYKYLRSAKFISDSLSDDKGDRLGEYLYDKQKTPAGDGFFQKAGENISLYTNPLEAAKNADVLYTDVFISMGEETMGQEKKRDFENYIIDSGLVAHAKKTAIVMHCLPAHRGEEITSEVLEGSQSAVFDQAENRMHAMRGLFAYILGGALACEGSM